MVKAFGLVVHRSVHTYMRATGTERDRCRRFHSVAYEKAKVDGEPGRSSRPLGLDALRRSKDVGTELDVSLQPLGRQEAQQCELLLERNCFGSPMTLS